MDSPILAHDSRTMTFGKNKFFRCSDGTYRDKQNSIRFERGELFEGVAPPARSAGKPGKTGDRDYSETIRRRIKLEIEAGR